MLFKIWRREDKELINIEMTWRESLKRAQTGDKLYLALWLPACSHTWVCYSCMRWQQLLVRLCLQLSLRHVGLLLSRDLAGTLPDKSRDSCWSFGGKLFLARKRITWRSYKSCDAEVRGKVRNTRGLGEHQIQVLYTCFTIVGGQPAHQMHGIWEVTKQKTGIFIRKM